MMTVGALRKVFESLSDDMWVLGPTGPIEKIFIEPGANEPFLMLLERSAEDPRVDDPDIRKQGRFIVCRQQADGAIVLTDEL